MSKVKIKILLYIVLSTIWRKKLVLIIPTLLFSILGLLLGMTVIQKYQTSTKILIQEPAKINPFLEDLSIDINLKKRFNAIQSLLHSNHILHGVLKDLNMITDQDSSFNIQRKVQLLSKSLSMSLSGEELVTIKYVSKQKINMATILDAVSKRLIEKILEPSLSSINKSTNFLNKELENSRNNLMVAEEQLAIFKSKHSKELPSLHNNNISTLTKLQETISEKESTYEGHKAALVSLKEKIIRTNPVAGEVEKQIIDLSSELEVLSSRYTNRHPKIIAIQRKLKLLNERKAVILSKSQTILDQEHEDNIWNLTSLIKSEDKNNPLLVLQFEQIEEAAAKAQFIEKELINLRKREKLLLENINNVGIIDLELSKLNREVKVLRDVYESILERSKMAHITQELGKFEFPSYVAIIDKPYTPTYPITMPASIYTILGLIGGIIIGSGIVTITSLADSIIRYPYQLKELLKIDHLDIIPLTKEYNNPIVYNIEQIINKKTPS